MAVNMGKWPSKQGLISKIRPSDGSGRDAIPPAVERWYDFPEFGGYLGNVGLRQPPPSYEQVGLVEAEMKGFVEQRDIDRMVAELKRRAAKMGANGLLLDPFFQGMRLGN